ncbi:MAG: zinc-ribbon domain-containing protein [Desulfuromonadales bacterium]|nr:zinc-ribbon domain-containing protein [Desulfuromonadales bacterium]
MKIECPSCHFSADVDAARIPPKGANTRCPRCATAFRVVPDATPAPISPTLPFRFGHGRSEILTWATDGRLAVEKLPRALRLAGALPGPLEWRRFLDGLALWLGAVCLAAAVIFFFAYNWQELGHFTRFGIVELLLAAAILASWRLGLERIAGKAALLVATLLVGALLALVGQTYQTGADPWELFATWALCVLPWVAVARFAPLWLVWLTLVNLAVGLYYHAFAGLFGFLFGTETLWWVLAGVNTLALAAWELAAGRGVSWLAERWAPRIVATASLGYATLLAAWTIVDHDSVGIAALAGYSVWLACAYVVYRHRIRDLYVLALGVLSLVIVVAVFLGNNLLRHGDAGAFLFIGLVVLGLSAAGGWWLRVVAREVEA